jgi:hypothetical protein
MNRHTLDLEHKRILRKSKTRVRHWNPPKSMSKNGTRHALHGLFRTVAKTLQTGSGAVGSIELQKKSDGLDYHLRTGNTLLKYYDIAEGTTLEKVRNRST